MLGFICAFGRNLSYCMIGTSGSVVVDVIKTSHGTLNIKVVRRPSSELEYDLHKSQLIYVYGI